MDEDVRPESAVNQEPTASRPRRRRAAGRPAGPPVENPESATTPAGRKSEAEQATVTDEVNATFARTAPEVPVAGPVAAVQPVGPAEDAVRGDDEELSEPTEAGPAEHVEADDGEPVAEPEGADGVAPGNDQTEPAPVAGYDHMSVFLPPDHGRDEVVVDAPDVDLGDITAEAFFLAPEFDPEDFEAEPVSEPEAPAGAAESKPPESGQRRRRGKGRRGGADSRAAEGQPAESTSESAEASEEEGADEGQESGDSESSSSKRRRRRRRRSNDAESAEEPEGEGSSDGVVAVKGSTRLEAKRQRRKEGRDAGRRRSPVISEAEFLARRESVDRVMVVRGQEDRTQIAVLEDDILVEHYVARDHNKSLIGDVYLGRVQNVLPSMEAAFIDIGRGRNAVLYAGEVNWQEAGLEGQPKRIELALKSGDSVLVQVTKDPVGQKGARLTSQISLPGRYLVYVPNGKMTGISRKLPEKERNRLKKTLKAALPENAGVIVRTAAEGASEEQLSSDVARLSAQWEDISGKAGTAKAPALLHSEPDLAIRVVRDIFNEDFARMVVSGSQVYDTLREYIDWVAPELSDRMVAWTGGKDAFAEHRIDEQIVKALDRKVHLPSGGSLVIDRTEAMTVVDVNTGRFVGSGGNLEETVTRNNLEAAEEVVRQLRLRDIGGIIVVDFIDMVLESNRDLVVRRLVECLGRDRTKHQVAEITSLGLVQMTRKRIGQGLLETFSEPCECCNGRGVKVHTEPAGGTKRRRPPGPIPGAPMKSDPPAKAEGPGSPGEPDPSAEPETAGQAQPPVEVELPADAPAVPVGAEAVNRPAGPPGASGEAGA